MRHFLFENKDYRINPSFKRKRKEQDSVVELARHLRRLNSSLRSKSSGGGSGSGRGRVVDARQKCVAKMQYSDSIKAHSVQGKEYLVKEGKGIDGGKPELYGTPSEEYQDNMVGRNFRIFLSPQSDKIDLSDLAERFIKKLEQQTGYSLYWQAANHYNTAHPHAHLLINGKDKDGKEVEIPRDIVKTFMRGYARDICTSQIGLRTREEMELDRAKELEAPRFTRIDEDIKKAFGGGSSLSSSQIYANREKMLVRLENLRKMGMCNYADGKYQFSSDWEENLRANGRYNTFLKARSELKYTGQMNLKVFSGEHGIIRGKVTKVYRTDDDASDNHAVILECPDGKAYFVPLFKPPILHNSKDKTNKTNLQAGGFASIHTYESQRGRLTPVIFEQDISDLRNDIRNKGLTGPLAKEVMSGPSIRNISNR